VYGWPARVPVAPVSKPARQPASQPSSRHPSLVQSPSNPGLWPLTTTRSLHSNRPPPPSHPPSPAAARNTLEPSNPALFPWRPLPKKFGKSFSSFHHPRSRYVTDQKISIFLGHFLLPFDFHQGRVLLRSFSAPHPQRRQLSAPVLCILLSSETRITPVRRALRISL
jgi:hypothetical protein